MRKDRLNTCQNIIKYHDKQNDLATSPGIKEHNCVPTTVSFCGTVPRHVAIIMDGNGRWANRRLLPRLDGHRAGAKTVRMVVEESRKIGVRYLTLFTFSTENWQRPRFEVNGLMSLLNQYLQSEIDQLIANGVRLRAIGNRANLPKHVRLVLEKAENASSHCDKLDLVLALSYGGRQELVAAAKNMVQKVLGGELNLEDITEGSFRSCLESPDIPDPDLLIRASGEQRISNFMLWQLAYSEIVVSRLCWPEFSKIEWSRCLREYSARVRKFGRTEGQLAAGDGAEEQGEVKYDKSDFTDDDVGNDQTNSNKVFSSGPSLSGKSGLGKVRLGSASSKFDSSSELAMHEIIG